MSKWMNVPVQEPRGSVVVAGALLSTSLGWVRMGGERKQDLYHGYT